MNFTLADWGARSAVLKNMFLNFTGYPFQLESQSWFRAIIQSWNPQNEQADCAEFTNKLLGWIAARCISNHWQRRVLQAETAVTHDQGATFMPITIQIDPAIHDGAFVPLAALIRHWSGELGMSAGLTTAAELFCLHIDRMTIAPNGQLHKLHTPIRFDLAVEVPILPIDSQAFTQRYVPIAARSCPFTVKPSPRDMSQLQPWPTQVMPIVATTRPS